MSMARRVSRRIGRFALRTVLLVVVPLVAVAIGTYIYAESGRYVTTENAYIKSNVVAISSDVSGRVEWVGVDDNTLVREGQILFRLDQQPFKIALERSEAELELMRTQVEHLRADYHEAVAQVAAEEEKVKFLTRQLARQKTLKERKLASEQAYDVAAHDLSLARRQVRVLRQRVHGVLQSLGGDPAIEAQEHPRFLRARTERDQAMIALADTTVEAPVDGVVSNMKLQAGEYVEEGHAVFTVIENGKVWVEANLKETQLTHVLEGQTASITVDAYPGVEWPATVDAIAPATGAEFSVLPPQNATGNWVKVVQRIPVLLDVEQPPKGHPLRAGMTVTVAIDTERERAMPVSLRAWFDDDVFNRVRTYGRSLRASTGFVSSAQAAGGG
ncbi:MAG: HlyD family secretion protein [Thiotrichales bacterium]|nr:HlyD family secretion protein [Thiotrichales bacterium]